MVGEPPFVAYCVDLHTISPVREIAPGVSCEQTSLAVLKKKVQVSIGILL